MRAIKFGYAGHLFPIPPISDTSDGVRLDKHTHRPVASSSQGAPPPLQLAPEQQLGMWIAKGTGREESQTAQPRGGYRIAPPNDQTKGARSPDSTSSRPSRKNDRRYEK